MCAGGSKRKEVPLPITAHQTSFNKQLLAKLVGLSRFELLTPRLSSVCSNQLSYRPFNLPERTRRSAQARVLHEILSKNQRPFSAELKLGVANERVRFSQN